MLLCKYRIQASLCFNGPACLRLGAPQASVNIPTPSVRRGWGNRSYFVPVGAELGSAAGVGAGDSAGAGTAAGAGAGEGATLGAAVGAGAGASAGAGLLTGAARPALYSSLLISFTSEF